MTHNFQDIPRADIPRSSFDRSHGYKTTFDGGKLVPFYVDEALPGDTFNCRVNAFARLATPIKPIMDNMFMETFFFSVPVRQVWDNWEKFNGEQDDPADTTDYLVPQINIAAGTSIPNQGIYDYMGLPTGVTNTDEWSFSSLFIRAYRHIFNEWFRDQNHLAKVSVPRGDGPDDYAEMSGLFNRRKRPDYFTSCLPWPQKGEPVSVPIGVNAPVIPDPAGSAPTFQGPGGAPQASTIGWNGEDGADTRAAFSNPAGTAGVKMASWADPGLIADLTDATSVTINDLRQSFQVQKILERDARGGTRYPEILKAHFGVTDPQMLVLQRPEFLGGGTTPVNITPVEQTAPTDAANTELTPQGNLSAFGTATIRGHGFTKSFTEHCIIIGLVNVRADLTYQQGLDRMWSRNTRFDFFWPALSHIGEQAVLNKEIYLKGENAADEAVFGYQERFAEYRYKPSKITGKFRSTDPESLDVWHLADEYTDTPVLGQPWLSGIPPIDRIIAVQDEPHFLFDSFIKLRCARPMPLYGVPGMIDHF